MADIEPLFPNMPITRPEHRDTLTLRRENQVDRIAALIDPPGGQMRVNQPADPPR